MYGGDVAYVAINENIFWIEHFDVWYICCALHHMSS